MAKKRRKRYEPNGELLDKGRRQPSPTEEEIAERAADIRSRWSDTQFRYRAAYQPTPVTPPVFSLWLTPYGVACERVED